MSIFSYMQQADNIYTLCEKIIQILESQDNEDIKKLVDEYKTFLMDHRKQSQLSVAFIGQYNAGKSSTIAALTNAKFAHKEYQEVDGEEKLVEVYQVDGDKLYVGAQIMTDEAREYNWKDVHIIDTPGIYAGRTDHDQKTLDQISKSDLLVYVISNELFNPQGGSFFRRLVKEMQRGSQMLLVVNKMSRESGTPEILKKSILEVIEPYHPSDFYTTFIDAKDYLKAQQEENDEERGYLIEDSNMVSFQNSLIQLIEKNQLTARLATPLHRGIEVLEKSLNIVSTDNQLSLDMLEILRRKSLLITATETRFRNATRSELNKVEHQVIMAGEKVAGKVDGQHSEEEVNASVKEAENDIEVYTKTTLDQIQSYLSNEIERLEGELDNLQNSSLVKSVAASLQARLAEKKALNESDIAEKGKIPPILTKGPEYLGKLGNFASKVTKEQVYDFVKFFGGKFKPWGATKLTKFINKMGPALSIVGVVLDVFFSAKEEVDEAKYEQDLRESRAKVRDEFRNVAKEIVSEYEQIIETEILPFFREELTIIEQQQNEIRDVEDQKEKIVSEINNLLKTAKTKLRIVVGV